MDGVVLGKVVACEVVDGVVIVTFWYDNTLAVCELKGF